MRLMGFAVVLLVLAVASIRAFEKPKVRSCMKICPTDFTPVCAGISRDSKEKPISFGNMCVMSNYNCENDKDLILLAYGQCDGNPSIRLSK